MAGGNPFLPPGSAQPSPMPGANPGGPVGQGAGVSPTSPSLRGPTTDATDVPPPTPRGSRPAQTPLQAVGKMMQAHYDDGMRAQKVLDHLRGELDQLMDMGDMVRPEHVIEAAGRLVGHGIGATQLAQIMSDMPSVGGEGLASWIRMHDVTVADTQQKLSMENDLIRHRLGMVGMRMMAEQHVQGRLQMHAQAARDAAGPLSSPGGGPPMPANSLGGGGENA